MGKVLLIIVVVVLMAGLALAKSKKALATGQRFAVVSDFDVTSGDLDKSGDQIVVNSKMMRATLKSDTPQTLNAFFTYVGPTKSVSRLQSGDIRHQFGFKLASVNECNLVYVMWDFDTQRIRISVKSNPGCSNFNQCRDNGYMGLPSIPAPKVEAGSSHTLTAKLDGTSLIVSADEQNINVTLPDVAATFSGPAGLRSDNAEVLFRLRVGGEN